MRIKDYFIGLAPAEAKETLKIRLNVEWQQSCRGGGCKNGERKTKERKSWKKLLFKRFLNES